MPSVMETKRKCKCRKLNLPNAGRVVVRCERHRGKPTNSGRVLCYVDEDGIVRREVSEKASSPPRVLSAATPLAGVQCLTPDPHGSFRARAGV